MRRTGLTVEELAGQLGVHPQTIRQWRSREGLPGVVVGGKLSLDLDAVLAWAVERGKKLKLAKHAEAPAAAELGALQVGGDRLRGESADFTQEKLETELRLLKARAEKEELKNAITRGDYVLKEVALLFFGSMCQAIRTRLDVVPERLGGEVGAVDEDAAREAIRREMDSIQAELPADFSEGLSAAAVEEVDEEDEAEDAGGDPD
jgi:excisionase family DNA binding protein